MKKEILQNNEYLYEVKYIISKKKWAVYKFNKQYNSKTLVFFKNRLGNRPCNLGPQYKNTECTKYRENNKLHNLYGPAWIVRWCKTSQYYIYEIKYTKYKFRKYIKIYNNLSYKRTY